MFVSGAEWSAVIDGAAPETGQPEVGQDVVVHGVSGLLLTVRAAT